MECPVQPNPKFLPLDQRIKYLEDNGYARPGSISETFIEALRLINFHHFLGYARNYRKLIRLGLVRGDESLDRLLTIISLDRRFSVLVFQGLQLLEWRLRALAVEHHCALFDTTRCFFEAAHYAKTSLDEQPAEALLREQVLRMKEPYIVRHFERWRDRLELPKGLEPSRWRVEHQDVALAELPIWTIIDGLTLGLLVRVLMNTKSVRIDGEDVWLWKRVAHALATSNQTFAGDLRGMIDLRNQVAHHARLWMRTTTNSPRPPKLFRAKLRSVHPKSIYTGVAALAALISTMPEGKEFLRDIENLVKEDEIFELGIKAPIVSKTG